MMKKKIVSFLLSLFIAFSFAACGAKPRGEVDYVPKSYAEMNLEHIDSDGTAVNDYRDNYIGNQFFSDSEDSVTYTANAMYDIFTLANKWYKNNTGMGQQIVHRFGGTTPKYFEWMAQKSFWTDDTALKSYVRETLINYPIMQRGQFWTWHKSPRWPVSANAQNGSYHYDDQFRFVSAVKQIIAWEQSTDILGNVDGNIYSLALDDQGNEIAPADVDVSINKTVREKMDMAVNFIMNDLNGKNGLIILPGENTGKRASKSSNYFDSYCYGNKSAYETQLFFHMLFDLIEIESAVATEYQENGETEKARETELKIQSYKTLTQTVSRKFVEEFYDAKKGRFIATIDSDGNRWDFGMVTQNLEGITYNVAPDKDKIIMDWVNGTREIASDTSTGKDIYEHKIAPRTNTLKIETSQIRENGEWKYWWHGMPEIHPASNQQWNESQVNGGILFWTSYYDLMSRFKMLGSENAMNRFKVISDEYEVDMLFRDPANKLGSKWKLGVVDEFPESGLVPLAYLNGMLGIDASVDGLKISPILPKAYEFAGVKTLCFGGNTYKITAYKNNTLILEGVNFIKGKFIYTPKDGNVFKVKFLSKDGAERSSKTITKQDGKLIINLSEMENVQKIEIVKES